MTYIKKYFLPWFLLFNLIFIVPLFFKTETASDDAFIVIPMMAVSLALFCSAVYFLWDTKWGPQQRAKKMNKAPFTNFYQLGFEKKQDFAIGTISGYQVILQYNWSGSSGKPSVSFETLFNPKKNNVFVPQSSIDDLNKAHKKSRLIWNRNCLTREWEFNFRPPTFEKIFPFIERSIQLLIAEKFEPLTLQESDNLIPEFKKLLGDERNRK